MFDEMKKQPDSGEFWTWLAANASRMMAAGRKGAEDAADELTLVFKHSYPDLFWELTPHDSGPWVFCVSADGIPERFDAVRAAVAKAPLIQGIEVVAFRQRGPVAVTIEIEGRRLGCDDVWCNVESVGAQARATLLIRGLSKESEEALWMAALILLDNAVGEYDSVTKIRELGYGILPNKPVRTATFFPLSELPTYLDGLTAGAGADA